MKKYNLKASGLPLKKFLCVNEEGVYWLSDYPDNSSTRKKEFTKEEILALPEKWMQHLEWVEVEELKYYLKAERGRDGYQYLNYDIVDNVYELDSDFGNDSFQTKFTFQEIQNLPNWCRYLERIPAND